MHLARRQSTNSLGAAGAGGIVLHGCLLHNGIDFASVEHLGYGDGQVLQGLVLSRLQVGGLGNLLQSRFFSSVLQRRDYYLPVVRTLRNPESHAPIVVRRWQRGLLGLPCHSTAMLVLAIE